MRKQREHVAQKDFHVPDSSLASEGTPNTGVRIFSIDEECAGPGALSELKGCCGYSCIGEVLNSSKGKLQLQTYISKISKSKAFQL